MLLRLFPLMLLVSLLLGACGSPPSATAPVAAPYQNLSAAQLAEMLPAKDFTLVNTHVPYAGEIEQTDAFIAYAERGPQRVAEYPPDKNAKIVVYCRSGNMSAQVAAELAQAGYTNVWNLEGGLMAWEAAGYTVLRK